MVHGNVCDLMLALASGFI